MAKYHIKKKKKKEEEEERKKEENKRTKEKQLTIEEVQQLNKITYLLRGHPKAFSAYK